MRRRRLRSSSLHLFPLHSLRTWRYLHLHLSHGSRFRRSQAWMHPRGAGQMRHETIAIAMNPRCHLMMIIEKNKQNPSSHSRYQLCFLFSYHILSGEVSFEKFHRLCRVMSYTKYINCNMIKVKTRYFMSIEDIHNCKERECQLVSLKMRPCSFP